MIKLLRYFKIYSLSILLNYALLEINLLLRRFFLNSYSQWGEDVFIDKLLGEKNKGFYIDVGAYDPIRFSNTKRFYLKGWRGINIEPDPIRIKKFYDERSGDINLNIGIANKNGVLTFFRFDPQTLSTFSKNMTTIYQGNGHHLAETVKVKVCKLDKILEENFKGKTIDFLSIDTEGFDQEVLKSNNWKRFRPKVICIETHDSKTEKLLSKLGYKKVYENQTNVIFMHELDNA